MSCGKGNCQSGSCGQSNGHYYCNQTQAPNFVPAFQVRNPGGCGNGDPNDISNTYGSYANAPCGLAGPGTCGTCCWDSTLCYPVKQPCKSGDRHVTIQMPAVSPSLTGDVGAVLAVYNYSVQNVLSRTMKFIASYYDWVYCQNMKIDPPNDEDACHNSAGCCTFLPPASLFTQFAQVVSFGITVVEQSNLSDCLCSSLCGILQLLVGLDSNKNIRDFILNNAFEGNKYDKYRTAGCGNLYNEEYFSSTYGGAIVSFIELVTEVAKSLDAVDDPERAETILQKICRCLVSAAAGDSACCCEFPKGDNACPSVQQDCGTTTECPQPQVSPVLSGYDTRYRAQFYALVVDWLQFILFDRDCRKFPDDNCDCCPQPPSVEQWLEKRCKVGTGEGQCVVCTGACKGYRRSDDFKPMLSSLLALKHSVSLYTLPRTGDYQSAVSGIYGSIVSDYSNLYGTGEVTLYPDCAAPQFCCSSELTCYAEQQSNLGGPRCCATCKPVCDACNVPPRQVPDIDSRKMTQECDDSMTVIEPGANVCGAYKGCYTPEVCGIQTGQCATTTDTPMQNVNCNAANPCVRMPAIFPIVDCSDSCCDQDCGCW